MRTKYVNSTDTGSTDKYRMCSLCNLGKTADPNIPYSENIIDANDDLTSNELWALWGNDRNRDGMTDNTPQWWPSTIELFRIIFQ